MPNIGPTELIILFLVCVVPLAVVALVVVTIILAIKKNSRKKPRLCPYCRSKIPADASVCKYCSRAIEPEAESSSPST
jgi:hypothetical protein